MQEANVMGPTEYIDEAAAAVDEAELLGDEDLSRIDMLLRGAAAYLREVLTMVSQGEEMTQIRSLFSRITSLYHKYRLSEWVAAHSRATLPA